MRLTAIVAAATFSHGLPAWGQCSNDAGAGDTAEGEVCPADLYEDTTNSGCNASPPVFTDVAADGGLPRTYCSSGSTYKRTRTCDEDGDCPDMLCVGDPKPGDGVDEGLCVGVSEPSVPTRDTDWYLVSQAQLTAADTDGNGTVRITSAVTGEMSGPGVGIDLVTFVITVNNLVDCNASVSGSVGCWDSTGGNGQTIASEVITISEEPSGVIVFVAPGGCNGAAIFDGVECSTGLNDYTVTIATDPVFETEAFTACGDPAQNPQLLPCNQVNPGVNGCDDPECCAIVCEQAIPFCCTHEFGWIELCVSAAIDLGCTPECCDGPRCLGTGLDSSVDAYCKICADPYGSWSGDTFGGEGQGDTEWGDAYNPIGGAGPPALDLQEVSFTNGFYFFQRDSNGNGIARELLSSNVVAWQQIFAPDDSIQRTLVGDGSLKFDDDSNGIWDRFESDFHLNGPSLGAGLDFHLTQQIEQVDQIMGVATVLTQTLVITNNDADPVDFTLVRSMDGDLVWDAAATRTDDTVGTGANGSGCLSVFQGESGLPSTYITISSPQADVYFGAKAGVDPDGAGPCPPMTDGSDLPLWNAYGVPCGWENYIAGVGTDVNGESGPAPPGCTPPCDASIGLSIPVSLDPFATTTVFVYTTYGAASPLGAICESCPWDCGDFDGVVGIVDFLALLAQWGQVDTPCDSSGEGVGIDDFLQLLANWGPCP